MVGSVTGPALAGLSVEELAARLSTHPDTASGTVDFTKNKKMSLSSTLVRAIWRGRCTLAVGSDVKAVVRIGALNDLLAWHQTFRSTRFE